MAGESTERDRTCVRDVARLPYGRFRKALDCGHTLQALSAAAELQHVALSDALELVLLLARTEGEGRRFRRAAARWQARYVREAGDIDTAEEAQAVLGLLTILAGPRRVPAACALAKLLDRRELMPASELLLRRRPRP